jgi:hydrogenase maturation protease
MLLIIGYGNTLRSDDGAGYRVAEMVAEWNLKEVRGIPCHQLTPELAEDIANANKVIFIDAVATTPHREINLKPVEMGEIQNSLGHSYNMRSLLTLSLALYGKVPPAYSLLIPAVNFDFGEQLSPVTETGIIQAMKILGSIIH